ncbi:hypothetical protein [Candidatus Annandia pinicola]|uniref:hypothetical protein n=1 Tax=Candidatus Annandia pinicola TaxID=1345117 RepID=UPI001D0233DB|nr:hypothetical protein [Candidatus Annandia pinicola]UDG80275.1 hypothetical protein GFK87_00036 [Candidatus Annandia pinicola]
MKIYKLNRTSFVYKKEYFLDNNNRLPIFVGILIKSKDYNYIINEINKILYRYKIYYIYSSLDIGPQLVFFEKKIYQNIIKNRIKKEYINIAIIPFTVHNIINIDKKKYTFILIYNNKMIFNNDNNIEFNKTTLMSIGRKVPSHQEIEDSIFAYDMLFKINEELIFYVYNKRLNHFETMDTFHDRCKQNIHYKPLSKTCVMSIVDCESLGERHFSISKSMGVSCIIKPIGDEDDQRILRYACRNNISMLLIKNKNKKKKKKDYSF